MRVDGRKVGSVKDQLAGIPMASLAVADVYLSAGVHTFESTYPHADLTPGNGETLGTGKYAGEARRSLLAAVVLQPLQYPRSELIGVSAAQARGLCGRPLNWVEVVSGGASGS